MKKNVGSQVIGATLINASNGAAFTGAVSVAVTGNGGNQAAGGGSAPGHKGEGYHSYSPTQAETNYDHVAFTFWDDGADAAIPVTVQVYPTFPQTGDAYNEVGVAGVGLTALNDLSAAEVNAEVDTAISGAALATAASVAALNDISTAQVNTEVDTAIQTYGLDHLVQTSVTGTDIADDSIIAQLVSSSATADWDDFVNTTDSLQALRDWIGDGTNLSEAGGDGDHLTNIQLGSQTFDNTGTWTGNIVGTINELGTQAKADVNAEVVDVLSTDAGSLPGQEAPSATAPIATMIAYLYKAWRNKTTQDATTYQVFDDAGTTVDQKATVSDDTTTATVDKVGTGP